MPMKGTDQSQVHLRAMHQQQHHQQQQQQNDEDHQDQNMKKKKCTLSGTTESTSVKNGKKSVKVSIVNSHTDNEKVFRAFSANSIVSLRIRIVLHCVSNGACVMVTTFRMVLCSLLLGMNLLLRLVLGLGLLSGLAFGIPGCVRISMRFFKCEDVVVGIIDGYDRRSL